jgi:hypothetical protein
MASTKQSRRGAKASRSSFRDKAKSKPKAKAKPAAKPTTKPARSQKQPAPAVRDPDRVRPAPTLLGEITVPSGKLAIFDIGLFGYLPREALEPAIVTANVPADRPLAVVATPMGSGRFADCWRHVCVVIGGGEVHTSRKLGEAGVDFARLVCMDHAALDHWVHEDSLDGRADFLFWGRDEKHLAASMRAPWSRDGYGWTDLPVAEAEAKGDEAARRKAANKWLLATDYRPHSHHYRALAAARDSTHRAGTLELAGTTLLLFFTSWGDGVFPIYLDLDADDRPVRVRIQLATAESNNVNP